MNIANRPQTDLWGLLEGSMAVTLGQMYRHQREIVGSDRAREREIDREREKEREREREGEKREVEGVDVN